MGRFHCNYHNKVVSWSCPTHAGARCWAETGVGTGASQSLVPTLRVFRRFECRTRVRAMDNTSMQAKELDGEVVKGRSGVRIAKVWYHTNEPNRVHYVARRADGSTRHLWEPRASEWGQILCEWVVR